MGSFAKNNAIGAAKGAGTFGLNALKGGIALSQGATGDSLGALRTITSPNPSALQPLNTTQAQASTATQVGLAVASVIAPLGGAGEAAEGSMVLAGHGAWDGTMMTLPEGTSLTIPTGLGGSISDACGNAIETGASLTPYADEMAGAQSYLPGSQAPDLTLLPPTSDLNIAPSSTTVSSPTNLSDIVQPNQGNIKWAACCGDEE